MDHEATWRRIKDIRFLELAPIGRASECKRTWITRSFGELLKLPEVKECLHARDATIHHRARLGAVRGPAARTRDGSPIRLPSSSHTRPGGLREAGSGPGLRLRLLADSRRGVFGHHPQAQARRMGQNWYN